MILGLGRGWFPVKVREFVAHLRNLPGYGGQIAHVEGIPPRAAQYGTLSRPLPDRLQDTLNQRGLDRLYTHQAEAIDAVRDGHDVVVATGTASGKTLCYNLPVLESIVKEPLSRALYLFPTKALAQDQLRSLSQLTASTPLGSIRLGTYDGDTPQGSRARTRRTAAIILSNPDMLHVGILPNHLLWESFFRHLKYVVIDEAHTYRGIFGCHVACVMRRLRRLCELHGSKPQFILCSATIANPGEHAMRLTGRKAVVVDRDGAPRGPRQFVLWNPPYVDEARGRRRSTITEATWLFGELAKEGVRNITFVGARVVAELIFSYAQEALGRERPELVERLSSYRGGYLPRERRRIEKRLFSGELIGVTATSALELGIDVGHLDASVLVGYPGTIASTWQRAGRAGRGKREALSILIALDSPLDQYFMRHPQELFGRSPEHALLDPSNSHVLKAHLPCAAFESPLDGDDASLFGDGYLVARADLEEEGTLSPRDARSYFSLDDYPAQHVNLRATSRDTFLLVDETDGGQVLEEIDGDTALSRVHPGAVYLHRAESYLVTRLDLVDRIAHLCPTDVTYFTQVRGLNDVHIVRSSQVRHLEPTDVFFGQVRVTEQITGFVRRQRFTEAILSEEPLDFPPQSFETQAIWFEVPANIQALIAKEGLDFAGGLHAVEHAGIGILPLFAMCDRRDIAGVSTPMHADTGRPQVFIYDAHPGGVGIARKGYDLVEEWWQRVLQAVAACPCESGCPSCVQSPQCGNNNEPLDKHAAVLILQELLGQQSVPCGDADVAATWPSSGPSA